MKSLLATLALSGALTAPAVGQTVTDDYCALNGMSIFAIGDMYVSHNLARSDVFTLIDEFFAPGNWSDGTIWNNADGLIRAMDAGTTPRAFGEAVREECLKD